MKSVMSSMCMIAVFGVGVAVSAQSPPADKGYMDKKAMMKDGPMTVAGCVSASKVSGKYMLTNAMMMDSMMGKEMDKDKMKDPAMAGHQMMSYELVGGSDLKAHMGHKVEVTGTMSKMDMDRMQKTHTMEMDKDKKDKMEMGKMSDKAMKLHVKSVKMVSETCS